MSKEISLFNNYHTKENTITNYCGMMIKMLYEESATAFDTLMSNLIEDDDFSSITKFRQQVKAKDSIPDLIIHQNAFHLVFELKRTDWFDLKEKGQIEKHLDAFHFLGNANNVLFLLAYFDNDNYTDRFKEFIEIAKEKNILVAPISFEKLLNCMEEIANEEKLSNTFFRFLKEFRQFLDNNDLLPSWNTRLTVVNCASTINEVENFNAYMCPNSGGAYKHRRAKYFGAYKQKNVKYVFEIKAVVNIYSESGKSEIMWNNSIIANNLLIKDAESTISKLSRRIEELQNSENGLRVFLLENKTEVNFKKVSKGGMFGNKKYFDLSDSLKEGDSIETVLKNKHWDEI